MSKKFCRYAMCATLTSLLILTGVVNAADSISPKFPGCSAKSTIGTPDLFIGLGVQAYYTVYGVWPNTWQEVVSSGLYQVPIVGPSLQKVNPDDRQMDFAMDAYYFRGDGGKPTIFSPHPKSLKKMQQALEPRATYSELFNAYGMVRTTGFDGRHYLSDGNMLKLFAILYQLNSQLEYYSNFKGNYPKTMDDLIAAGWSPVNRQSVNPVTGKPFKFDGSAGDIRFVYLEKDKKSGAYAVHVERNGAEPTHRFTY